MSVMIIDFESTGVDTKSARITEIGAKICGDKWTHTKDELSTLVWESGYPAITPEVTRVTNITQEMLSKDGIDPKKALTMLAKLATPDKVKYIVAYNKGYDENLFREEVRRHGLEAKEEFRYILSTPWLCAMVDVELNYKFKCWKLSHLALDHGIEVNPKELHRAMGDVELTRRMLNHINVTPTEMYNFQVEPWIYTKAVVEKPWLDGGESTALCKAMGYSWEQAKGDTTGRRFEKQWVKRIKDRDYEGELNLPFKVARIGG